MQGMVINKVSKVHYNNNKKIGKINCMKMKISAQNNVPVKFPARNRWHT